MGSTHTGITMIVKTAPWFSMPVTVLPLFLFGTTESPRLIATAAGIFPS